MKQCKVSGAWDEGQVLCAVKKRTKQTNLAETEVFIASTIYPGATTSCWQTLPENKENKTNQKDQ